MNTIFCLLVPYAPSRFIKSLRVKGLHEQLEITSVGSDFDMASGAFLLPMDCSAPSAEDVPPLILSHTHSAYPWIAPERIWLVEAPACHIDSLSPSDRAHKRSNLTVTSHGQSPIYIGDNDQLSQAAELAFDFTVERWTELPVPKASKRTFLRFWRS